MSSEDAAAGDQGATVAATDGSSAASPKRRRLDAFEAAGDVILTVWSIIGSFLDPLDLSRCAKTCRELRKVTINEHDGKIVATHVSIGHYPNKPQNRCRALHSVCLPKIQALSIRLRGTVVDGREINDERTGAFPMLVGALSACRNLEEFSIDTDDLFQNDRLGNLDANMELLEEYLLSCQRLHSLTVTSGHIKSTDSSVEAIVQIVTKIIARNRLSVLNLDFNDSGFEANPSVTDLAHAILQANNLKHLEFSCNYPLFSKLVNKVQESSKSRGRLNAPPGLLRLAMRGEFFPMPHWCNLSELLNFYSNCHNLESIELVFPLVVWDNLDDCLECLKALLLSKKHLRALSLEFNCIKDRKVGDFIADLATTKEWIEFYVGQLRFGTEAVDKIIQHLKHSGIEYEYDEKKRGIEWVDCNLLWFPLQEEQRS